MNFINFDNVILAFDKSIVDNLEKRRVEACST
jgi:hypothetical protein